MSELIITVHLKRDRTSSVGRDTHRIVEVAASLYDRATASSAIIVCVRTVDGKCVEPPEIQQLAEVSECELTVRVVAVVVELLLEARYSKVISENRTGLRNRAREIRVHPHVIGFCVE